MIHTKGYHVTAVQNPLTSLADDVAATRRVLERQQGDVILVGHSWAGAVVTQAGNALNVKGIVYLSALVPDSGESAVDLLQKRAAPMDGMKPDDAVKKLLAKNIIASSSPYKVSYVRLTPSIINSEEEVDICLRELENIKA